MIRTASLSRLGLVAAFMLASWSAGAAPVNVAAHGKRLEIGTGNAKVTVLYLRGTPYEMGYAQGALCKKEVAHLVNDVLPLMLMGMGVTPQKADAIWKGYASHMRPDYLEELRGLADGSGLPLAAIQRFHAVPDISEWHCTFFAASRGPAAKQLIQIRALDYETRAGIQKYPALVVYKPDKGVPFVNVSWLGHCGLVTGMNAAGIAMSEIGDKWDKENDDLNGRPLNYVMRDVVEFARSMDEAVSLVKDQPRTSSLLYCVSSARENLVRAFQTSRTQCKIYSSENLPFTTKPGLVFMSMGIHSDWNNKVGGWLLKRYGKLDPQAAMQMMKELRTGSLHAAIFLPGSGEMWVANATENTMAYDRPYVHFSLAKALRDPFFAK